MENSYWRKKVIDELERHAGCARDRQAGLAK
eukprot:CAMPEP_0168356744 /NCGR_PEP_ID=MMETSP0228-20121227/213_1 /TAXON_ID=133427 /ORGANISM="Protoceratium reticulatum, Strain CCCM 535 (=CCMP 1889)" /LENGTH=30 /DNA_ID= /DNA_START= /DNA_END= /DNA_ORIENTATION=